MTITELKANSYSGRYEYSGMTGSFSATGEKTLQNVNGNKEGVGSFDAYSMGAENFSYNLHPTSLETADTLAALVGEIIDELKGELSEEGEEE